MDEWNRHPYDDDESRADRALGAEYLIARLRLVKHHLMAVDGWSKADVDALNEAIEILKLGGVK